VVFNPGGGLVASSSGFIVEKFSIRLWDTKTGAELTVLEAHTSAISALAFNLAGDLLASKSADGTVRLWRVETGQQLATLDVAPGWKYVPGDIAFSPDGKLLVSDGGDGTLCLWAVY
jgi:WD40 repeat protein